MLNYHTLPTFYEPARAVCVHDIHGNLFFQRHFCHKLRWIRIDDRVRLSANLVRSSWNDGRMILWCQTVAWLHSTAARSTRSKSLPPCESQWLSWPDFRQKSRRRECLRPASHHSLNRKYPTLALPKNSSCSSGSTPLPTMAPNVSSRS